MAGVVDAFAGACTRVAAASHPESQQRALAAARQAFEALSLSGPQLQALLRLPWRHMQVPSSTLVAYRAEKRGAVWCPQDECPTDRFDTCWTFKLQHITRTST